MSMAAVLQHEHVASGVIIVIIVVLMHHVVWHLVKFQSKIRSWIASVADLGDAIVRLGTGRVKMVVLLDLELHLVVVVVEKRRSTAVSRAASIGRA